MSAALADEVLLTFDTDWAPDWAIDVVADGLIEHELKSTWFITHDSPAIGRLRQRTDLFELGIHPNFRSGSSHGSTESEVLEHVSRLVPDGRVMRTHGLIQSSALLDLAVSQFGIEVDLSLLLPHTPHLQPHTIRFRDHGKPLLRIPYFCEDDIEAYDPDRTWDFKSPQYHLPGLKVLGFHPTYICLNCDTMESYGRLKEIGPLYSLDRSTYELFANRQTRGAGSWFRQVCEWMATEQGHSRTVSEWVSAWKHDRAG